MTALASRAVKGRMLKERTSELVARVGGLEAAANFCRVSKTALGRYTSQSPADADYFAPVDVVRCLETAAGEAIVTAHLASEAGGVFVAVPDVSASGADLLQLLSEQSRESSELTSAICTGLADGILTGAEGRRIMREAEQLAAVAMRMRAEVALIVGEG
ncbi:phage regulatory CII family protein [Sphingomonas sp. Leaf4]|uniref:phage regulatory CII family protein n=1 Tax=Sphingomonas sp. Leaf4 TaxID=2876553 RepID=UPI001E5C4A9E|nr:phage regulatory CII family protein [Sphingomonas sp. Leaf4]